MSTILNRSDKHVELTDCLSTDPSALPQAEDANDEDYEIKTIETTLK